MLKLIGHGSYWARQATGCPLLGPWAVAISSPSTFKLYLKHCLTLLQFYEAMFRRFNFHRHRKWHGSVRTNALSLLMDLSTRVQQKFFSLTPLKNFLRAV